MKCFIDGGANIGQTFRQFLVPERMFDHHVVCVEPSLRHLHTLEEIVCITAPRFAGVTIVTAALGRVLPKHGRDGGPMDYMAIGTTDLSDALVGRSTHASEPASYQTLAPLITLSDLLHKVDAHDSTVKLDIEGAEYEVLYDLLENPVGHAGRVSRLLVEWHEKPGMSDVTRDAMREDLQRRFKQRFGLEIEEWPF